MSSHAFGRSQVRAGWSGATFALAASELHGEFSVVGEAITRRSGSRISRLSYRYAFFEGDNADTPVSEAFDPPFLGFSD